MNNSQSSGADQTFGNLSARVRTGGALAAVFLALLVIAALGCWGRWLLLLVTALMLAAAALEHSDLSVQPGESEIRWRKLLGALLVALPAALVVAYAFRQGLCSGLADCGSVIALAAGGVYCAFLVGFVVLAARARSGLGEIAVPSQQFMFGLLLIGFGGACLAGLILLPIGVGKILWLVLVVCSNDIAAYFVGSRARGPLLAPTISPRKTWSGTLAGFAVGGILGTITFGLVTVDLGVTSALIISLVIVAGAQIGDLAKSLIKRLAGAKDSGDLLPGHGGVLDRIDGLLGAAPIYYLLLGFSLGG